jgi:ubiquitin carboxyl-terminal hydrolase 34
MEESYRERAVSSEPCCSSGRPFDDTTEQISRKRQKVSRSVSRSRSADTARNSDILPDSMPLEEGATHSGFPVTPPSDQAPAELPTSSRVTINLRTNRPLESIPSSPPSPSKLAHENVRFSAESESDVMSTTGAIETPSASPSDGGSPEVEIVTIEDDSDFTDRDTVAIIATDNDMYLDPLAGFPYFAEAETLVQTVNRLSRFLQYGMCIKSCFYSSTNTS